MVRQRIGKIVFWVGVFSVIPFQALNWMMTPVHRVNSRGDLSGSVWSPDGGAGFSAWQLAAVLTIVLPIVGALVLSGKKRSFFWLWGFVPFITYNLGVFWKPAQYRPALFGIGGAFILVSYFGMLWLWTRTYGEVEGAAKMGRQIQMLGYSFLLITALFLCLYVGNPNLPAVAHLGVSAEMVLIALSVAMVLLFAGHYVAARGTQKAAVSAQTRPQPVASGAEGD